MTPADKAAAWNKVAAAIEAEYPGVLTSMLAAAILRYGTLETTAAGVVPTLRISIEELVGVATGYKLALNANAFGVIEAVLLSPQKALK